MVISNLKSLNDIQGEYGLPNNASTTAIDDANQSIFDSARSLLAQTRSNSLESLTSRGLGRSSFGEQAMLKQENDIMGQANTLVANNNLANVNADNSMFRDIFKMSQEGNIKDISTNLQFDKISQKQLEQFIPTLFLNQLDKIGAGEKAPIFDASKELLFNLFKGSADVGLSGLSTGIGAIGGIKGLLEDFGNLFNGSLTGSSGNGTQQGGFSIPI